MSQLGHYYGLATADRDWPALRVHVMRDAGDLAHHGRMDKKRSGWITYAAVVMCLAGVMHIFDAVWAFNYHGALPDGLSGAAFGQDLHTYGWIDVIVAIILVACGFGVLSGSQVGRWVGILSAGLTCIAAVVIMPYYPVWSITYIIMSSLVIYALAAYGGEAPGDHTRPGDHSGAHSS